MGVGSASRSVELVVSVDVRRFDLNQFVADSVSVFLSFRWNWGSGAALATSGAPVPTYYLRIPNGRHRSASDTSFQLPNNDCAWVDMTKVCGEEMPCAVSNKTPSGEAPGRIHGAIVQNPHRG